MRKIWNVLAVAGLLTLGAGAASAQGLNVRIGVNDPAPRHRVVVQERYQQPHHDNRRWKKDYRPRMRTVCRVEMRRHVRRNGVVVRRPVEICRRVVARR